MKIYHNPRCSKSRCSLSILEDKKLDFEVVKYLESPLTANEIKELVKKLGIKAEELVRKGESIFKENYKGKKLSEKEWIEAMVKYPILIERPIFVNGDKAVIGRPPERINEIL